MKFAAGLAFPEADTFMVKETAADGSYQRSHLKTALRHVKEHGCAIDGGAHVGLWSRILSGHFERVVAFEPSADTFECLAWNLKEAGCQNVETHQAALGSEPGAVSMVLDPINAARANTGARHVEQGGPIPVITIDSLALERVGFIKLDIEGSELAALKGAKDTLKRCRPIVLFEEKGLGARYFGLPQKSVGAWLTARGYRLLAQVSCDEIWGPK